MKQDSDPQPFQDVQPRPQEAPSRLLKGEQPQKMPSAGIQLGHPQFQATLGSSHINKIGPSRFSFEKESCVTAAWFLVPCSISPRLRLYNLTCHNFGWESMSQPLSLKVTSLSTIYYPVLSLNRKCSRSSCTEWWDACLSCQLGYLY